MSTTYIHSLWGIHLHKLVRSFTMCIDPTMLLPSYGDVARAQLSHFTQQREAGTFSGGGKKWECVLYFIRAEKFVLWETGNRTGRESDRRGTETKGCGHRAAALFRSPMYYYTYSTDFWSSSRCSSINGSAPPPSACFSHYTYFLSFLPSHSLSLPLIQMHSSSQAQRAWVWIMLGIQYVDVQKNTYVQDSSPAANLK